jgi:hypothetical protein
MGDAGGTGVVSGSGVGFGAGVGSKKGSRAGVGLVSTVWKLIAPCVKHDVSEAERKSVVHPNAVGDDLGWEAAYN